jgi:YggT family protein
MQVFFFLIDTVFFVLVASALLRAWLNGVRISMAQQPGTFVMAVTDWLVMPLRRMLPTSVQRSRWDIASLSAATVLCLIHAVVLLGLGGLWSAPNGVSAALSPSAWALLPFMVVKLLVRTAVQALLWLVVGYAILSWVQPYSPVQALLSRLLSPVLLPLRRWVPLVGGIDLSALVLVLVLQVALMILG